ncbi:MAG: hypothetical protein IJ833_07330 [Lachnospiraceae bacterium]|nr:hypothetical protein [Lachnospiraceae bacterium]
MIDWEKVIQAESADELKEVKLWLFRENMRLQNEQKELAEAKDKFLNERVKLRNEIDELNRRTVMERKKLKQESMFFDKKMAILQDGFRKLEEDRRAFDREKRLHAQEMTYSHGRGMQNDELVDILFRNVNNPLALRKRYKDLVKIFHPDNMFGDAEMMQLINKEFQRRREDMTG